MSVLAAGPVVKPLRLLRAAHPLHALVAAAVLGVAALASGRPAREAALVAATVLVGQAVLGWHNDLVDRSRDAARDRDGKPLASGGLDPGTVWFALACSVLVVVPLALGNGITAGAAYLLSLAVAMLGNVALRRTSVSGLPWAASFGLLPAFLSYGGWGGRPTARHRPSPPRSWPLCSASPSTSSSHSPTSSTTTPTACGTYPCASRCGSGRRDCSGSASRPPYSCSPAWPRQAGRSVCTSSWQPAGPAVTPWKEQGSSTLGCRARTPVDHEGL